MVDKLKLDDSVYSRLSKAISDGFITGINAMKVAQTGKTSYSYNSSQQEFDFGKSYKRQQTKSEYTSDLLNRSKNDDVDVSKIMRSISGFNSKDISASIGKASSARNIGLGGIAFGLGANLASTVASVAINAVTQTSGIGNAVKAFTNYYDPKITTYSNTGSNSNIADYFNGKYAFNLVINAPTATDLVRLDEHFYWNGITVNETDIPLIYKEGYVKDPLKQKPITGDNKNSVLFVKNNSNEEFTIVQTIGANVLCKNKFAQEQMIKMLDNGLRWFDDDFVNKE